MHVHAVLLDFRSGTYYADETSIWINLATPAAANYLCRHNVLTRCLVSTNEKPLYAGFVAISQTHMSDFAQTELMRIVSILYLYQWH